MRVFCFASALGFARKLARMGVDAIVIEGNEAGGHIGPVSTGVLAQEILPHFFGLPVFVAGGIGRGEAMLAYLEMGAAGVQLGTRFVCAHESIAHPRFKQAFIRASARDAVASVQLDHRFPVIPVRALSNPATERFIAMQRSVIDRFVRGELTQRAAQLEIEHFWAGALRRAVIDGDIETGSLMAGQSVGLVTREQTTAEILEELVGQALAVLAARSRRALDRPLPRLSGEADARRMTEAGGNVSGTRRLLRRLRDVMAGSGSAQERLDRIVRIIAAEMVAEVCSAYVMRAGEVLELFATEGLRPEAVHRTRLRIGEGLVGVIAATARPLALADAQSHPDFAYRPETGEEIYHSLMGVPILRGGRVLGVLVVQNRSPRHYTEDEIEVLQTVAMVVAELAASGDLVNPLEMAQAHGGGMLPLRLVGIRINGGLAMGPAVLHEPRLLIRQVVAEDSAAELDRLRGAVKRMREAIDELVATSRGLGLGEHRDVLESYRMFAADRGWVGRIADAIRSGLTAEAAVQKVRDETRTRMMQVGDPYLRERLHDLEDLANRLQQHLSGCRASAAAAELPPEFIVVARMMGPAELMDYAASADHRAWSSRKARRPRMWPLSRGHWTFRWSAGSLTRRAGSRRETPSSSMAITARS